MDTNILIALEFEGDHFHKKAWALYPGFSKPCTSSTAMSEFGHVCEVLNRLARRILAGIGNELEAGDPAKAVTNAIFDAEVAFPKDSGRIAAIAECFMEAFDGFVSGAYDRSQMERFLTSEIRGLKRSFQAKTVCAIHPVSDLTLDSHSHIGSKIANIIKENLGDVRVLLSAVVLQQTTVPDLRSFHTFDRKDFSRHKDLSVIVKPIVVTVHS